MILTSFTTECSMAQIVPAVPAAKNGSERYPVSYRTLDDANSYFPGRNDPNKNLEINKKKFMG